MIQMITGLIVLVIAVFVILLGVSIYFIKTGRMTAKEWSLKSLGLPQGSVRALIAFLLLFTLIYVVLKNMTVPDLPDWLVGIMGTVIGFYFGAATVHKPPEKLEEGKTTEKPKEGTTPGTQ